MPQLVPMNKKVLLMILDGWGITQDPTVSAIFNAETPFIDSLQHQYPSAKLRTDGEYVGLPQGQMGNSEVGHMNLGAGRVVYQNLAKINNAVKEGSFSKEQELLKAFEYAKKNQRCVHLLGLVSNGGIHSHINHLKALLDAAKQNNVCKVYLHAFTDGRDCDPESGKHFIKEIDQYMKRTTGQLATVMGRYYAMDRDKRWERIKLAYEAMVNGVGKYSSNALESIEKCYEHKITDEFIKPIVMVDQHGNPNARIKKDDVVIFFNFRTDRGRQLTEVLSQTDLIPFQMHKLPLYFLTLTNYNKAFKHIKVIYDNARIKNTLGEVLENAQKKQLRIAETEKYPHVTFFFSGGREKEFVGEKRVLCPSPKVATYDLEPQMSAYKIKDAVIPELEKKTADFVCVNFANGDMVGHTGVYDAAVKACETVDDCTKQVVTSALMSGYTTLLIADHGNCEIMTNPDGSPHTAHTTSPVPLILIDKKIKQIKDGVLGDIAPTILDLMGIEKPIEMTGESLLRE